MKHSLVPGHLAPVTTGHPLQQPRHGRAQPAPGSDRPQNRCSSLGRLPAPQGRGEEVRRGTALDCTGLKSSVAWHSTAQRGTGRYGTLPGSGGVTAQLRAGSASNPTEDLFPGTLIFLNEVPIAPFLELLTRIKSHLGNHLLQKSQISP